MRLDPTPRAFVLKRRATVRESKLFEIVRELGRRPAATDRARVIGAQETASTRDEWVIDSATRRKPESGVGIQREDGVLAQGSGPKRQQPLTLEMISVEQVIRVERNQAPIFRMDDVDA